MSDVTVFISYSRTDVIFAERLKAGLRAAGATIWIDHESLQPGDPDWQDAIRRGIEAATALIYIGSPDAARSSNVRSEIVIARTRAPARPIYPLWARGEHWADCAPFELIPSNYSDARDAAYPAAFVRLCQVLGLRVPVAPPASPAAPNPSIAPPPTSSGLDIPPQLVNLGFRGLHQNGISAIVPPLIRIPAGPFLMGSDPAVDTLANANEQPQHWAATELFEIAQYPVTVAEYAAHVNAGYPLPHGADDLNFYSISWLTQLAHFVRQMGILKGAQDAVPAAKSFRVLMVVAADWWIDMRHRQ
jgi:hypothetical protein